MDGNKKSIVFRLEPNNEVIGTLHAVKEGEKSNKLQFSFIKEIELTNTAVPIEKLHSLVGKNIGIINIDGQFFVREI